LQAAVGRLGMSSLSRRARRHARPVATLLVAKLPAKSPSTGRASQPTRAERLRSRTRLSVAMPAPTLNKLTVELTSVVDAVPGRDRWTLRRPNRGARVPDGRRDRTTTREALTHRPRDRKARRSQSPCSNLDTPPSRGASELDVAARLLAIPTLQQPRVNPARPTYRC